MEHRQETQQRLAARGEPNEHVPTVVVRSSPPDETASLHTVDQFDGAVVLDLQALRQDADRRLTTLWHSLQREQQLVLLGLEARRTCCTLAEMQKPPELVTELGQRPILGRRERVVDHHLIYIAAR